MSFQWKNRFLGFQKLFISKWEIVVLLGNLTLVHLGKILIGDLPQKSPMGNQI